MSAEKIGPQHRARKAVLYVRQSSAHQVQHNRESQALQYAMRERLHGLVFAEVEVIDEDLGWPSWAAYVRACSGSSSTGSTIARPTDECCRRSV